jgi:hypothetical protein
MVCAEKKNRLNGFSWARSWFTALKRGVNEMISTEHDKIKTQNSKKVIKKHNAV